MYISSQHHSFDIKLAAMYGVEEAILIHHMAHWIRINANNGRNQRDGRTWTYQTRKAIKDYFPYWSVDRVKYLCEKLVSLGILVTEQYNKKAMDRTIWYAFADEKLFGVDVENSKSFYEKAKVPLRMGKSASAIPDTKTKEIKETSLKRGKEKSAAPPPPSQENFYKGKFEDKIFVTASQRNRLVKKFNNETIVDEYAEKVFRWSFNNEPSFKKKKRHDFVIEDWIEKDLNSSQKQARILKDQPMNDEEVKNYAKNHENIEKLKEQSPRCSGLYFYHLDRVLKDKNNPLCNIDGLLNPKEFCRKLEEATGLTIFKVWFPNGE